MLNEQHFPTTKNDSGVHTSNPLFPHHHKLDMHAQRLAKSKRYSISEALAHIIESGIRSTECEIETDRVTGRPADLSQRQIAVLQGLRDGLAVKEIAHKLNVGEATVRTHITRIRERTGCVDILKLRMP